MKSFSFNRVKAAAYLALFCGASLIFLHSGASWADPLPIANGADLQNIQNDLSGEYYLLGDISLSSGFTPIGTDTSPFTGTLDGRDHEITGLTVNSGDYSGLFGYIGSSGVVRDLRVSGASITGGGNTGGIAGYNAGVILRSFAMGVIDGADFTGGLVGYNAGEIARCFSRGKVTGGQSSGGLAGYNAGTISNSYSRVDAAGEDFTGGLVGYNLGTVQRTYATGPVASIVYGAYIHGGLIGFNDGVVADSFWDTQAVWPPSSDGGAEKTTAEMKLIETFSEAGWDFNTVWNRNSGYNSGYPFLRWRWNAPLEPDPQPDPGPDPVPEPEEPEQPVDPDNGGDNGFVPGTGADQEDDYNIACFIATAAYGSPLSLEAEALREFRDTCLLKSGAGRTMSDLYYRISPGAAGRISGSKVFRKAARLHLHPIVAAAGILSSIF